SRASLPINGPAGSPQSTTTLGLKAHQTHPTTIHSSASPSPSGSLRPSSPRLALLPAALRPPRAPLASVRHSQIPIVPSELGAPLPALSFLGGFRTTAPVLVASSEMGRHPKPITQAVIHALLQRYTWTI